MGHRVKVKFTRNYISTVGASIAGMKDSYKVFPPGEQLDALIADGTLELCSDTPAATRETATVEAPEATGKAQHKKSKKKAAAK